MSDSYMTDFWRTAPPPWNTLGPEIAALAVRGILPHADHFPANVPEAKLTRWSRQLREARHATTLTRQEVSEETGIGEHSIWTVEANKAGKESPAWAKLAAFYGITLG